MITTKFVYYAAFCGCPLIRYKKCALQMIFFNEKMFLKDSDPFWHRKTHVKKEGIFFLKYPFICQLTFINEKAGN